MDVTIIPVVTELMAQAKKKANVREEKSGKHGIKFSQRMLLFLRKIYLRIYYAHVPGQFLTRYI